MREIKFRAWDKENKIFQPVCVNTNGEACIFGYTGLEVKFDNIQQFTGLKDKNGKDIYEGDIVKFRKHKATDSHIRVGEVYFADGDIAQFKIKWFEDEFERRKNYPSTTDFNLREIEVIGNIFENPDLIN